MKNTDTKILALIRWCVSCALMAIAAIPVVTSFSSST